MLHVSILDLISRSEDIDRKIRLGSQNRQFIECISVFVYHLVNILQSLTSLYSRCEALVDANFRPWG